MLSFKRYWSALLLKHTSHAELLGLSKQRNAKTKRPYFIISRIPKYDKPLTNDFKLMFATE